MAEFLSQWWALVFERPDGTDHIRVVGFDAPVSMTEAGRFAIRYLNEKPWLAFAKDAYPVDYVECEEEEEG